VLTSDPTSFAEVGDDKHPSAEVVKAKDCGITE